MGTSFRNAIPSLNHNAGAYGRGHGGHGRAPFDSYSMAPKSEVFILHFIEIL